MSKRCLTCGMHSNENRVLKTKITKLEAEVARLKAALNEAMEWNWLDWDAPERFDPDNLPEILEAGE